MGFATLLSIGTQFGLQYWVGFWAGPTMLYNLEKITFGSIQSKLFPKYGLIGVASSVIAAAAYYFSHSGG